MAPFNSICRFMRWLQASWKRLLQRFAYSELRSPTEQQRYRRLNINATSGPYDTEVNSTIVSVTRIDEIMECLIQHGCQDITADLDPNVENNYIARGGFGIIYSGHLHDRRPVAIKCLEVLNNQSWAEDGYSVDLKHTARELHTWSKCSHPALLPLLGMARFRGSIAMVSPLMANGRLDRYISQNPSANRIGLGIQIAGALEYLHDKGIIHGDIKAANVLVSEEGHPKVADFGNAVISPCTLEMSTTTSFGCSMRWAAPEILATGAGKQTAPADVYGLGMTLLEIFTGRLPYADKDERSVVCAVVLRNELPPRPEFSWLARDEASSDDIWELLMRCWAYNPTMRPTALQVKDELLRIERQVKTFESS